MQYAYAKSLSYGFLILLLSSPILQALEQKNSQAEQEEQEWIPEGFENITLDYQGPVEIHLGQDNLGEADINYTEKTDQITLSQEAITLIIEAADSTLNEEGKKQAPLDLSETHKANSLLTHAFLARDPLQVSLYYDMKNMKLFVFIPPKYLNAAVKFYEYSQFHPRPFNYQNPALFSNFRMNYTEYLQNPIGKIDWRSQGALSSGEFNINYDLKSDPEDDYVINTLYLVHYGNKYESRLGYLASTNISAGSPGKYWGFLSRESKRLINPQFLQAYAIPLMIELDQHYRVKILHQDGQVLFDKILPFGESMISTGNFPLGTYDITIEKEDLLSGNTTSSTQLFSKQGALYNWLYSGFAVAAGVQTDEFEEPDWEDDEKKFFQLKNGFHALSGQFDYSYGYIEEKHYLGLTYDHLSRDNFDYSIGITADDSGNMKSRLIASLNSKPNFINLAITNERSSKQDANQQTSSDNDLTRYFIGYQYNKDFLSFNTSINGDNQDEEIHKNSSIGTSTSFSDWTINGQFTYNYKDHHEIRLKIAKLIKNKHMSGTISLSLLKSATKEFAGILSMSFSLGYKKLTANMTMNRKLEESGKNYSLGYQWHNDNLKIKQNVNIPNEKVPNSTVSADLKTNFANFRGDSYLRYYQNQVIMERKSIGFDTMLVLTPQGYMIKSDRSNTGVIVDLPKVQEDENYSFTIDRKELLQNDKIFIPKSYFRKSQVSLSTQDEKYILKPTHFETILYPQNIHYFSPQLIKTCMVSFIPKIGKEYYFIIAGNEDAFFADEEETYAVIQEGSRLQFEALVDDEEEDAGFVCDTGVTVDCLQEDLGELSCINDKTKATSTANKEQDD